MATAQQLLVALECPTCLDSWAKCRDSWSRCRLLEVSEIQSGQKTQYKNLCALRLRRRLREQRHWLRGRQQRQRRSWWSLRCHAHHASWTSWNAHWHAWDAHWNACHAHWTSRNAHRFAHGNAQSGRTVRWDWFVCPSCTALMTTVGTFCWIK